jgi:hypothetical protein
MRRGGRFPFRKGHRAGNGVASRDVRRIEDGRMTPKRNRGWLFLEWFGATFFRALPDTPFVNRLLSSVYYFVYNRRFPNLRSPRNFNERLLALKLSDEARAPLRARITDKELVKEHVTSLFGSGHVVPTLAVLRTAREVDAFEFPLPCVVKPTHSSQEVMFLRDRQPTKAERRMLKYWLKKSYFAANREPNYRNLEKKLIVEAPIGGGAIEDVKILCFHGIPKLIQVDHGRFRAHVRDYFDVSGRPLPIEMRKPRASLPFPYIEKLPEMLAMAETLARGFSFIRVDLYVAAGRVLVGELTSFPTNCTVAFRPLDADMKIAELFDDPALPIDAATFGVAKSGEGDGSARIIPFPACPAGREASPDGRRAAVGK